MNRIVLIAAATIAGAQAVQAADTSGAGALALAGLVAEHATGLSSVERQIMAKFLAGHSNVPAHAAFHVKADSVSCRASDVAIVDHSCVLKFGATTRNLAGRKAHELYATLVENGVQGDGAAGSIYESVKNLDCTIAPNEVKQNGGGASCSYAPGP
ncbi:MAG: hypothetical protein KGM42_08910 [Hyphomicrobiales bacterium]|nr:hypothetical protein [Hyphomicrobiales bacterium]